MEQIPAFIEQIFTENPSDDNCSAIASEIEMVENHINDLLNSGYYGQAAILFIQLAITVARHFINDSHWEYFDDDYEPQYVVDRLFQTFHNRMTRNRLSPQKRKKRLREAYRNFPGWNPSVSMDIHILILDLKG